MPATHATELLIGRRNELLKLIKVTTEPLRKEIEQIDKMLKVHKRASRPKKKGRGK